MNLPRRQFLHLAAGAAVFPTASHIARAQSYPTRPITIIVGFAAGGGADVIARTIAQRLRPELGQSVIVENVTGANSSIGIGRVARAAGDGYTLAMGSWSSFVANSATYSLSYDLIDDLAPVALVAIQPLIVTAKKAMPADDLKALVAWLKANPDKASAASNGVGSVQHVAALDFQKQTGTRFAVVPYRGGAPSAVQVSQQGPFVFVVKDNVATVALVKVARLLGEETVLESGVNDGDVVVTDGHLQLTNGARVTIREPKPGA